MLKPVQTCKIAASYPRGIHTWPLNLSTCIVGWASGTLAWSMTAYSSSRRSFYLACPAQSMHTLPFKGTHCSSAMLQRPARACPSRRHPPSDFYGPNPINVAGCTIITLLSNRPFAFSLYLLREGRNQQIPGSETAVSVLPSTALRSFALLTFVPE